MKIAFTTSGDHLDAPLDSRFGRAAKFLIYDSETEAVEVVDNAQNLNAAQGAGIQAAQTIARSGASCLITGHCGPKAFRVLQAAGVKIYHCPASTLRDALKAFQAGTLEQAQGANVAGHWA